MSDDAALGATQSDNRGGWPAALLIALTFFIATAPTLTWLEFSSGMENLTVSTTLESLRTGKWLAPTLEGEPRVAKPPLSGWIAAIGIRSKTFRDLDSPDAVMRANAYWTLAWEIRWTALACSCVMLLAIFHLGRTIGGVWPGLLAMTVAGSSLYWLRFGKQATTDVQLAMWNAIALAAIARICLVRTTWSASLVAGVAMGMALMSKGPVALLQVAAPAVVFLVWRKQRIRLLPILAAIIVMLLVGGAWYAWVAAKVPGVWERWRVELIREHPAQRTNNPLSYLSIFGYMVPWTIIFAHGVIWTLVEAIAIGRRKLDWGERGGWVLALLLVIVPIVLMSFFPDRKDRYLLPLLAPAAVLTARGLTAMLDPTDRRRIPPVVQWIMIVVIGVGMPIAGARFLKRLDGTPWLTTQIAAVAIAIVAALIGVSLIAARRWPIVIVGATAIVMLLMQPIFFFGYRDTREGRAEMRPLAELVRQEYPDAETYFWRPQGPRRIPADFSIYGNRTATWVADPSQLPPASVPQICITLHDRDDPQPPAPPGWNFLARVMRDNDWYPAFIRLPQTSRHKIFPSRINLPRRARTYCQPSEEDRDDRATGTAATVGVYGG